jgi:putative DNA primase/helicase
MGDSRTGDNHDSARAVDRILRISGEDPVEVDRKNRDIITAKLNVRFVLLANELPNFRDQAGAIVHRYHVIETTKTIPERQRDPTLADRIIAEEMPGVLNLALSGLGRLRKRGRFRQPSSSHRLLEDAADIASPVGRFIKDKFVVSEGSDVSRSEVYQAWKEWALDHGYQPGTDAVFFKNFRAAWPGLKEKKTGSDGQRVRVFLDIRRTL